MELNAQYSKLTENLFTRFFKSRTDAALTTDDINAMIQVARYI